MSAKLWLLGIAGSVLLPIGVLVATIQVDRRLRRTRSVVVLRALTSLLVALAVAAACLLAFTGGGHPPPIILLPVVPFAWALLQATLVAVLWLVHRRGARSAAFRS